MDAQPLQLFLVALDPLTKQTGLLHLVPGGGAIDGGSTISTGVPENQACFPIKEVSYENFDDKKIKNLAN